jgi:3-hydroxyisobutyrate dehydrogenase-like beta-hydroxyacid dehydrogenase
VSGFAQSTEGVVKVGFIGVGNIGSRQAGKLIDAGYELVVHDLSKEAASKVLERGAKWAASPRAVAEASEVIFASVPGPSDVEKLLLEPERGLLEGLSKGKVFVDLTTSFPTVTRRLAGLCRERGAEMLDSPVSSGGGTTLVVGGEKAAYDTAEPVLKAMATNVFYMGGSGMGNVTKLSRQYAGFVSFWAQMEALVMAAKAGADIKTVAEFMGITGAAQTSAGWLNAVLDHNFGTPETATARLDIVAKDVSLAIDLARLVGAPALTGLGADDIMKRGQARGWGRHQFHIAYRILEELAWLDDGNAVERA